MENSVIKQVKEMNKRYYNDLLEKFKTYIKGLTYNKDFISVYILEDTMYEDLSVWKVELNKWVAGGSIIRRDTGDKEYYERYSLIPEGLLNLLVNQKDVLCQFTLRVVDTNQAFFPNGHFEVLPLTNNKVLIHEVSDFSREGNSVIELKDVYSVGCAWIDNMIQNVDKGLTKEDKEAINIFNFNEKEVKQIEKDLNISTPYAYTYFDNAKNLSKQFKDTVKKLVGENCIALGLRISKITTKIGDKLVIPIKPNFYYVVDFESPYSSNYTVLNSRQQVIALTDM